MKTKSHIAHCLVLVAVITMFSASLSGQVIASAAAAACSGSDSAVVVKPVDETAPLTFKIGNAYITPVGFADATFVWRNTNTGAGIGTSFGSVPFGDTTAGNLSETRISAQNSRLGFRVDTKFNGFRLTGYTEADFLGFVPTNAAVSNNADTLRLRLYFATISKGRWEVLGGQAWSLLTPNRSGVSAIPSDLFITQSADSNYQAGLIWSRAAQFRAVYHAGKAITFALSLEAAEQYIGGSGGGGVITMPSALASAYATQLNNGTTTMGVPNARPDVVAKVAFDSKLFGKPFHLEAAGVSSEFKTYNPLRKQNFTAQGEGGSVNFMIAPGKNFRLVSANFYSHGGGRYIFGQAPDVIVRGDGSLSPVRSASTVTGVETAFGKIALFGYYGGVYVQRNVAIDPSNGSPVGYGYTGSPAGQNRSIQELTFGMNRTLWKNPAYGAVNVVSQFSYVFRSPWFVAPGGRTQATANMVFTGVRYTLPGGAPTLK